MSTMTIDEMMTAPTAATRPTAGAAVRLTRRGRLVVFLAGLALVLLVGFFVAGGSVATEQPGTPEPTRAVQVAPGDTLYAIAAAATTDDDVAAMVERIQDLNSLDSGMLVVGQELRVPID